MAPLTNCTVKQLYTVLCNVTGRPEIGLYRGISLFYTGQLWHCKQRFFSPSSTIDSRLIERGSSKGNIVGI
jgi:hypothetical protein